MSANVYAEVFFSLTLKGIFRRCAQRLSEAEQAVVLFSSQPLLIGIVHVCQN